MLSKPRDPSLKYHVVAEWPASCRNRDARVLKSRPDLVHRMNEFTERLMTLAKHYEGSVKLESEYNFKGIRMWFQRGDDIYDFLMKQSQNDIRVIPELYVVNGLNSRLDKFLFDVDDSGITVY